MNPANTVFPSSQTIGDDGQTRLILNDSSESVDHSSSESFNMPVVEEMNSAQDGADGFRNNSVGKYGSTKSKSESLVLCMHGNEYGKCCLDVSIHVDNELPKSETMVESLSDHCHTKSYTPKDAMARNRLIAASVVCLIFMIGEIIGGYLANSLAIMTDAAHLLTDFASFLISLFSLWVATRANTKRMNFGWYRAEVIGALTSVLLIWVVTGILVYMAVERIISKHYEINAVIMLITSGVGVLVNILMGAILHCGGGHGHSHGGGGHGHSHGGHSEKDSKNGDRTNINVRAAFIHVIGDFLQSIGVFVAALVIFFKPNWGIVDPICTFLFSVLVLVTTINILKDVLLVLMEGIPKGLNFSEVYETFLSISGVVKVHNLRIWSLSMDKIAMSAHVVVNPGVNTQQILKDASQVLRKKFTFFEMTLQIEDYRDEMKDCTQCQCPKD